MPPFLGKDKKKNLQFEFLFVILHIKRMLNNLA